MDNFHIDVRWEGESRFRDLLAMVLSNHNKKSGIFEYFDIDADYGLILYWTNSKSSKRLPYPMNANALIDFSWNWLNGANYGDEPDHDGDNGKGWRIFTESWGHVRDDWATICAIQPVWAMYGK